MSADNNGPDDGMLSADNNLCPPVIWIQVANVRPIEASSALHQPRRCAADEFTPRRRGSAEIVLAWSPGHARGLEGIQNRKTGGIRFIEC